MSTPWPMLPCPGSRQPSLRHIFSPITAQEFQVVCRPPGPGRGTVKVSHLPHTVTTHQEWVFSAPGIPARPVLYCTVLYCTVLYCALLQGYLPALFAWELEIEGVALLLGGWWLDTAARGEVRL